MILSKAKKLQLHDSFQEYEGHLKQMQNFTDQLKVSTMTSRGKFPDLSDFSSLLQSSGVAADLLHRSALTILADILSSSSTSPPPSLITPHNTPKQNKNIKPAKHKPLLPSLSDFSSLLQSSGVASAPPPPPPPPPSPQPRRATTNSGYLNFSAFGALKGPSSISQLHMVQI